MASVRAIAAHCSCSPATVSRALRQDPRLRAETVQRIHAAAAALGFPGQRANNSQAQRERLIVVLIQEPRLQASRHHLGAITGLRRAAAQRKVALIIHHHAGAPTLTALMKDTAVAAALADRRLSGVIIMGGCDISLAEELRQRAPVVSLGHDLPLPLVDAVQADHQRSAETLVQYLFDLGHRRIGLVIGRDNGAPTRDRLAGYQSALDRLGLPTDPALVLRHAGAQPGRAEIRVLSRVDTRDRATAWLIAGHDTLADIITQVQATGIAVPQQLSLVGFHQTGVLSDGRTPTACPIPAPRLGAELIDSLHDRWQGRSGGRRILITCPLQRGETAGPVPNM